MSITELIKELSSGEQRRIMAAAAEAAEQLELLEERIAIMSEELTVEQWQQQIKIAEARIAERRGVYS